MIRRINLSTDEEQVVAGNYAFGPQGIGGPATSAGIDSPGDVAVNSSGDIVIANSDANVIDYVPATSGTHFGQVMTAGDIYVVAGNGTSGYSGDGTVATSAELAGPPSVALDASDDIAIADANNNVIRFVPATSGTYFGRSMTAGGIYTVAGNGTSGYSGDGSAATNAELDGPGAVALGPSGALAISDSNNNVVRFVPNTSGTYFGRSMTAGDIYTIAGNGTAGYSGDGTSGPSAELSWPSAVAFDTSGDIAVADWYNNVIRFVPASSGTHYGQTMIAGNIYTVAGDGSAGSSGNGSAATSAELDGPSGVAVDAAGDLVVSDYWTNDVRVVAAATGELAGQSVTAGDIYLVGGDGFATYSGDGGPAGQGDLSAPQQVRVDSAGNVVIADSGNDVVRFVPATSGTYFGQAMTVGDIYTIAGDGSWGYSGDGGPAMGAELTDPEGAEIGPTGNLAIADTDDDVIRFVPATSGTYFGRSMTADDIYTVAGTGTSGYSGDGGSALSSELDSPTSVAVDASGGIVIADNENNVIRYVANTSGTHFGRSMTAGDIYTIAGNGTSGYLGNGAAATSAELSGPQAVSLDATGDVVVADTNNSVVRFVPVTSGTYFGQAMTADDIYTVAGDGTDGYGGDGGPATGAELTNGTADATFDAAGDLYIADSHDDTIRFVPASSGSYYGQVMTSDDIYTIAGAPWISGQSGDGGAATSAVFDRPQSAAPDPAGGFYVADTSNNKVRHVVTADVFVPSGPRPSSAGTISTFAGGTVGAVPGTDVGQLPNDVTTASVAGTTYAYVTDGPGNLVRRIDLSTGAEEVVAGSYAWGDEGIGGPATSAEFAAPSAAAGDDSGDLVIADSANNVIDYVPATSGTYFGQVMTAGDIYTIAGNRTAGYSGDGGAATSAEINGPSGVAIAPSGAIAIADTSNNAIRFVPATSGTYFGQAMTADDIYAVAGNGTAGYSGDGGPGKSAELSGPNSVAFDASGDLAIADTDNDAIPDLLTRPKQLRP